MILQDITLKNCTCTFDKPDWFYRAPKKSCLSINIFHIISIAMRLLLNQIYLNISGHLILKYKKFLVHANCNRQNYFVEYT